MTSKDKAEGARSLLAAFLNEHPDAEAAQVRAFAAEHPRQEQELAVLFAEIEQLRELVDFPPGVIAKHLGESGPSTDEGEFDLDARSQVDAGPASDADLIEDLPRETDTAGRYRIEGEVARGGMGSILKVWDRGLRRFLAMKVSLVSTASAGEEVAEQLGSRRLARFLEEAQITGQLDHPGIVPVHELGLDSKGHLYFTMRLVRGRELDTVFELVEKKEEGWTRTRALGVLLKVCDAVAFAHSKGVIHRDLKPSNVMVGRFGEVYVMDWGLAKVLGRASEEKVHEEADASDTVLLQTVRTPKAGESDSESPYLTNAGEVMGTPGYMPLEQALGNIEHLGPASDVYAVGAILYRLLAGRRPYEEPNTRQTAREVLQKTLDGPPTPLRVLQPSVPPELDAICSKAMARNTCNRYPTMEGMADDLRSYLEQRVVHAYEAGTLAEAKKWITRNRALASTLATALALLISGLAASLILNAQAQQSKRLALQEKEKSERLSDVTRLAEYVEESRSLWPAIPENIRAMREWLSKARALAQSFEDRRARLEAIRAKAMPLSQEVVVQDAETDPLLEAIVQLENRRDLTEAAKLSADSASATACLVSQSSYLNAEIARLRARLGRRRTWRFEDPEMALEQSALSRLVDGLEELTDPDPIRGRIANVESRLQYAEEVRARTIDAYWDDWSRAIANIQASPIYERFVLSPQLGLVPLGPDPHSGLWEFAELQTGTPPSRRATGELEVSDESSVVFVLIPGGTFTMGAQAKDQFAPNYDNEADHREAPCSVTLDPYFISKYEMTQGQWQRFTGDNPSFSRPENLIGYVSPLMHPVENVSWNQCKEVMTQLGWTLPTEAQWEYAARAGTTTKWTTGDDVLSLVGSAHYSPSVWQEFVDAAPDPVSIQKALVKNQSDVHIPGGVLQPNPFGLHDVCGNVWELCLDASDYCEEPHGGDGSRHTKGIRVRRIRGGGYRQHPSSSRSASRGGLIAPDFREASIGLRPVRGLER